MSKKESQFFTKRVMISIILFVLLPWIFVGLLEFDRFINSSDDPVVKFKNGLCLVVPRGCTSGFVGSNKVSFYCRNGSVGELNYFSSSETESEQREIQFISKESSPDKRQKYEFKFGETYYILSLLLNEGKPAGLGRPFVCQD